MKISERLLISFTFIVLLSGACENYQFDTAAPTDYFPAPEPVSPEVLSVYPPDNTTSIPVNSKATVTFNQKMNAVSLNSQSFNVKKGETLITGTISVADSIATFTPKQDLERGTVYTLTITTDVMNLSGQKILEKFSSTFTTEEEKDVTAPYVLTVVPAENSNDIPVNTVLTVNFSEPVSPEGITSSAFTLKKGSVAVQGALNVQGTSVKFTPSSVLTPGTMYTATITGIKDLAGNIQASNFTWNFTTASANSGKSFASDVVPILNLCNTCHKHGWTPSSNASSFYANLASEGYISTSNPTSGKIYKKLSGSHPSGSTISSAQKTTVLTWISEGSKNN